MATQPRVSGGDSEFSINQANQWMRSQPWYQAELARLGQRPDAVRLTESQRISLLRAAQANGMVIDEGDIEMDPAGNFNPRGHKMRNTLIGLGIAGAAALTGGAALGAFGGAGAGAGGLSGLAGASYVVPSAALGAGGGIGGTAAALGAGGLAGLAPASYTVPSATLGAGGGLATGGAAAGGAAGLGGLASGLRRFAPFASLLPAMRNAIGGSGGGGTNTQIPPELQQLLQMSMQRMTAQDPLFKSINAQAMAGLPTAYQRS